jgi:hypothetical protein
MITARAVHVPITWPPRSSRCTLQYTIARANTTWFSQAPTSCDIIRICSTSFALSPIRPNLDSTVRQQYIQPASPGREQPYTDISRSTVVRPIIHCQSSTLHHHHLRGHVSGTFSCQDLTCPLHLSSANHSNTASSRSFKLLTVCPGPLGPGSLNASTLRVCRAPTSRIVPPPRSSSSKQRSIASATSSGVAHSSLLGSRKVNFSGCSVQSGVLITPGATALTRIPSCASNEASERTKPCLDSHNQPPCHATDFVPKLTLHVSTPHIPA